MDDKKKYERKENNIRNKKSKLSNITTIFSQYILSDRLLLVDIGE